MKKLLLALVFSLLTLTPCFAQQGVHSRRFTIAGPDSAIALKNTAIAWHQLTWNVSGTASVCTVALDSSADGITWSAGGAITGQTCTSNGESSAVNIVANFVRINMTALTVTAGSSVTVTWDGYTNDPGTGGGSITSCTINGGIIYQAGTTNEGTCGPNFTFNHSINLFTLQSPTTSAVTIADWSNNASAMQFPGLFNFRGHGVGTWQGIPMILSLQQETELDGAIGITNINAVPGTGMAFVADDTGDSFIQSCGDGTNCNSVDLNADNDITLFAAAPSNQIHLHALSGADTDASFTSPLYLTTMNCSSSASPAVCGSAAAGSIAIPTGTTSSTLQVNTTAVTANSQIIFYPDDTLGAKLGSITCNNTLATLVGGSFISARTPGVSFTITFNGSILTNKVCGSYVIIN